MSGQRAGGGCLFILALVAMLLVFGRVAEACTEAPPPPIAPQQVPAPPQPPPQAPPVPTASAPVAPVPQGPSADERRILAAVARVRAREADAAGNRVTCASPSDCVTAWLQQRRVAGKPTNGADTISAGYEAQFDAAYKEAAAALKVPAARVKQAWLAHPVVARQLVETVR